MEELLRETLGDCVSSEQLYEVTNMPRAILTLVHIGAEGISVVKESYGRRRPRSGTPQTGYIESERWKDHERD